MKRVFILVLDSFGIGYSVDANVFCDLGSNTFGHISEYCYLGKANVGRYGPLYIPNLISLGLGHIYQKMYGQLPNGIIGSSNIISTHGYLSELSLSKDTTAGHWEIAGSPVLFKWDYFDNKKNSFSDLLMNYIIFKCNLSGILGNCHASGTDILYNFGELHIQTKKPIFYTSADSVIQIACHEEIFGLEELYQLCEAVRSILDQYKLNVARVIARPFIGENKFNFFRTNNRKDFSKPPNGITIMQKLISELNGQVIAIGKIADIFANVGVTKKICAFGLKDLMNCSINLVKTAPSNTIGFINFVDFDSLWGHRRDFVGYAQGLEFFDNQLPRLLHSLYDDDLLIITADHGCDPTWVGTDHTREYVPMLLYHKKLCNKYIGNRKTFSDIAQTVAKYFALSSMNYGISLL
ncbi:Phosphopentomutase [Buchnera aphidicola (Pterocallis alni)]|uniref:phosphopentomutase n=1 Tax=Buchnera aphidicola TaxID=9 RepID=UPI003463B6DC